MQYILRIYFKSTDYIDTEFHIDKQLSRDFTARQM